MPQESSAFTVDPKVLSLKEYPISIPAALQTPNPSYANWEEDLAIANGQVDFEAQDVSDGREAVHWQDNAIDDTESTCSSDFKYPQACSAPTRTWADGSSNDDSVVARQASSHFPRDDEPWNPMTQQFAFCLSRPDEKTLRAHETEAGPQWSSNLAVPNTYQPIRGTSQHRRQTYADSRSTHFGPASVSNLAVQPLAASSSSTPSHKRPRLFFQQLRHQGSDRRPRPRAKSSASSTSSSIPLSELELDNSPSQSPCSCTTVAHHPDQPNGGIQRTGIWTSDVVKEQAGTWGQASIGTSRPQSQFEDPDVSAPFTQSWQQKLSLHSVGQQFLDPVHTSHTSVPHYDVHTHQLQPTNDQYDSRYGNAAVVNYQDSHVNRQLDHPDAIMIPTNSQYYRSDQPSSFPITAGLFPTNIPPTNSQYYRSDQPSSFPITAGFFPTNTPPIQANRATQSTPKSRRSRDTITSPNAFSIPMRRKSSKKSGRASRSGSLNVIREDPKSFLNLSHGGSFKGRRNGPLSESTRSDAKQKRIGKTVCVRCHMMKQKCEGEDPCEGCRRNLNAKLWSHPCMKSHFLDLVESQSCNAVFQRAFCPLTLDGHRRAMIGVPKHFNVNFMLSRLASCQLSHNFLVHPFMGPSYTLDLAQCSAVFTKFHEARELDAYQLSNFMDSGAVPCSEWLGCIKDLDQNLNVLDLSINWNTMPSRNGYDLVSFNADETHRRLDVEKQVDFEDMFLAVQLCRIILRALEIEAFSALQRSINDLPKQRDEAAIKVLGDQIGQLLLSLRWRIAWWKLFDNWSRSPEALSRELSERNTRLTNVLYCYYFIAKKKGPAGNSLQSRQSNNSPLWGTLPHDDSPDGYHAWMQQGPETMDQAGRPQDL